MAPRERALVAGVALVMVVAGLLWLKRDPEQGAAGGDAAGTVTLKDPHPQVTLAPKPTTPAYSRTESLAARRAFVLQTAAGLTPIRRTRGGLSVNLVLKTVPTTPPCSAGDIEAINFELGKSRAGRLLVTAEPLTGEGFSPVAKALTLRQILSGFSAHLELPAVSKPTTVGFYLCKDASGADRCGNKTVKSINDVIKTYMSNDPSAFKRFDASDKVYFFAFGVLTKDAVMILPDSQATAQRYQALAQYLIAAGSSAADANKAVQRVKDVSAKLDVLPPQVAGSNLTMPLAYGHLKKCQANKRLAH